MKANQLMMFGRTTIVTVSIIWKSKIYCDRKWDFFNVNTRGRVQKPLCLKGLIENGKANFSLEQAVKDQRGCRGAIILFL